MAFDPEAPACRKPEGVKMGKGNNQRGNREAKKPKKVKEKVLVTAESGARKPMAQKVGKKSD